MRWFPLMSAAGCALGFGEMPREDCFRSPSKFQVSCPHTKELVPRHYPQLDVLRAVAVLLVMLIHSNGNVPALHLCKFFHYGNTGVDLFFVLSAFLSQAS